MTRISHINNSRETLLDWLTESCIELLFFTMSLARKTISIATFCSLFCFLSISIWFFFANYFLSILKNTFTQLHMIFFTLIVANAFKNWFLRMVMVRCRGLLCVNRHSWLWLDIRTHIVPRKVREICFNWFFLFF